MSKITWFIQNEEDNFIASKSYTAEGSYVPGDYLIKNLQIWNNYNGTEDVEDIENIQLVASFKNYEDNFLLNLMEISINDQEYEKLLILMDRGIINLGKFTGGSNIGSPTSSNCKNIKIKIGPIPSNISSNLKSVIFYLNECYTDTNVSANNIINENNSIHNFNNCLDEADKDLFLSNDKTILTVSTRYTDDKIKEITDKLVSLAPNNLNNFNEVAQAVNYNPYYAFDEQRDKNIIKADIDKLTELTFGFDTSIKTYIDSIDPGILESITAEEFQKLINDIKDTLNI